MEAFANCGAATPPGGFVAFGRGAAVSKTITIEQVVQALKCQGDGERVIVTYNADERRNIDVQSMDLLYVIISQLAEALEGQIGDEPARR